LKVASTGPIEIQQQRSRNEQKFANRRKFTGSRERLRFFTKKIASDTRVFTSGGCGISIALFAQQKKPIYLRQFTYKEGSWNVIT
jgi:hypothetical protein